jgi:glycosyltransferase involved in cell wall biosynthesis
MGASDNSGITPRAPRVAVLQWGSRHRYAVPQALEVAGVLGAVFVDHAVAPDSLYYRLLRAASMLHPGFARALAHQPAVPMQRVVAVNCAGITARALRRLDSVAAIGRIPGRLYTRGVTRSPVFADCDTVYGFVQSSCAVFEHAKRRGMATILDHYKVTAPCMARWYEQAFERWPEWTLGRERSLTKPTYGWDQQAQERALSDTIWAPSEFVRGDLLDSGVPPERIQCHPYGLDLGAFSDTTCRKAGDGPLKVLFVGGQPILKGLPDLLEAGLALGPKAARIRVIAPVSRFPAHLLARYEPIAEWVGPVPYAQMCDQYAWADLLCLPSLAEGSARVTFEARAMAVPIVVTPNTGSWVENGEDGLLVPPFAPQSIAAALHALRTDTGLLAHLSEQALLRIKAFSLSAYSATLQFVVCHTRSAAHASV